MRRLAIGSVALVVALGAPLGATAAASPTFRMSIVHYVRGCHVWKTSTVKGPSTSIRVARGTRVLIRLSCPMDFEFSQRTGPRLALRDVLSRAGTTRVVVFRKPGRYVLEARNLQSSDELGLETLGDDNTLTLIVRVR